MLTRFMKALFAALGARYFRWVFICIPHKYAGRINACHLKYSGLSFEPLGCQEHFGRLFKINMAMFSSDFRWIYSHYLHGALMLKQSS